MFWGGGNFVSAPALIKKPNASYTKFSTPPNILEEIFDISEIKFFNKPQKGL